MLHRLTWKEVLAGVFGLATVLVVAIAILAYGRIGRLHGRTYRLYVTTNEARGVSKGTEVWLDGQKVGLVTAVEFRPVSVAPDERVVLTLDVLDRARSQIRRDSRVMLQAGGNVLGAQVVSLSTGVPPSPALAEGDTMHAAPQMDLQTAAAQATNAMQDLPDILANVKQLASDAEMTRARYASLAKNESGEIAHLRGSTASLLDETTHGSGSAALMMRNDRASMLRAKHAMAAADSIFTLMGSGTDGLGRFRRDSTLPREIARARDELAAVESLAVRPGGTLQRAGSDSALERGVARDLASLDSLFVDVKRHPFRYIVF